MMRSFLNVIDIESGREIRLAEFGFEAKSPSFVSEGIAFYRDGKRFVLDPESGMISPYYGEICASSHGIRLAFDGEGLTYCEMILGGRVLVRFMGTKDSIGACPISGDGKKIVFFGYPANEFGA